MRITATVLEAIARHRPAVAYASSGAVYNADRTLTTDLDANPYGTLKHLDELALRRASADAGRSTAIARVFNVAGPYLVKPRGFALSDLVLQARERDELEIRARHPVLRSYADVDDLARLLLALLDAGEDAVFDTAGRRRSRSASSRAGSPHRLVGPTCRSGATPTPTHPPTATWATARHGPRSQGATGSCRATSTSRSPELRSTWPPAPAERSPVPR